MLFSLSSLNRASADEVRPFEVSAVTSAEPLSSAELPRPLIVVEVHPWVGRSIQPQLLRRLVELELSDVDVPVAFPAACPEGQPTPLESDTPRSLYVRVLPASSATLSVELWSRGERSGERRVSGEGPAQLAARRVAFAAAVLGRRLRQDRLDAREQHLTACYLAAEAARKGAGVFLVPARLAWHPRIVAASLGGTHAWLVGAEGQASLDFESGPSLALGLDFRAGDSERLPAAADLRWYGFVLRPGVTLAPQAALRLRVGVVLRAALLHAAGTAPHSANEGNASTWTSTAALDAELSFGAPENANFTLGVEAGSVLRRLELPTPLAGLPEPGRLRSLGGMWLGISVGAGLPL